MCTSIYFKTADQKHLLSRTMDFSYELNPNPIFMPRRYQWKSTIEGELRENKFGFVGAGKKLADHYFVADGVNEKGLAIAELYLPGEAKYQSSLDPDMINLAPHEFITFLLGNCASIEDVRILLSEIRLVEAKVPVMGIVTPLHWILTDCDGNCCVIEPTEKTLKLKPNPVGVMTNTPCLEWHLDNLRNYLNLSNKQRPSCQFGQYIAVPFSQGTGSLGLPGSYTPPDRFVRAAFFKEHTLEAQNEAEGVLNAYHILSTVFIPKGVVVTDRETNDYSQYIGIMCNESRTYYYSSYDNTQVSSIILDEELLKETEPRIFNINQEFIIRNLNV